MRMVEYQVSYPLRMELVPIQVMFTLHLVHGGLHPPKYGFLAVSISIILHNCTSMQNRCEQDMEHGATQSTMLKDRSLPKQITANTLSVVS